MRRTLRFTIALLALTAVAWMAADATGSDLFGKDAELGRRLDKKDMQMMKNGAMKNMDKYMGSKDAMMHTLPMSMMESQKGAVEEGKALFNNSALSSNGQSCGSCHPGGGTTGGMVQTPMKSELTGKPYDIPVPSLVGAAATFPKFKVPNDAVITVSQMANNCIMMFMAAKPLPLQSHEMTALTAYLHTLSRGEPVEPGKMPEMMKKMMGS